MTRSGWDRMREWFVFALVLQALGCGSDSSTGSGSSGTSGTGSGGGMSSTAGTSGGDTGAGGSSQGGAGGGRPADLHCEGEPDHCSCMLDTLNMWPPDTSTCKETEKIYCCKDPGYPSSDMCECAGWSCTESSMDCTCRPGVSSGTPTCSTQFARCCRSMGTDASCVGHNFPNCLDGEVEVPACVIADVGCGNSKMRTPDCRRETSWLRW